MRVLVIMLVVTGCIDEHVQTCGDVICPVSSVCIDNAVCATPDSIAACNALNDGDACHAATGDGYCTHGACAPNVCGDGMLTGIEQCDGNLVSTSCADFGYYAGTTTCTPLCTIDRSGCSGRCGD